MVPEEHALDLALVAMVSGTRPLVTITEVRTWLTSHFDIPGDITTMSVATTFKTS
jgi:hypothetical protein